MWLLIGAASGYSPLLPSNRVIGAGLQAAFCSALCSSFLLHADPVQAIPVSEAIVQTSEAAFPVLRTIKSDVGLSLYGDVAEVLLDNVEPDQLAKTVDLGIDAILSVPTDDLARFNAVVKEQYSGLSASNCELVPLLPPADVLSRLAKSDAAAKVDQARLKALNAAIESSLGLLPRTERAICLPPDASALSKLLLAQRDLAGSVGASAGRAFGAQASDALKVIPLSDLIAPALNAQRDLTNGASLSQKQALKLAAVKLESAVKIEAAKSANPKAR